MISFADFKRVIDRYDWKWLDDLTVEVFGADADELERELKRKGMENFEVQQTRGSALILLT